MTSLGRVLGLLLFILLVHSFGAGITLTPDTIPTNTPTGGYVATIAPNTLGETCTYSVIPTSSGGYVWFSVSNDSLFTTERFTGRYQDGDIVEVPLEVSSSIHGVYNVDYKMTVRAIPGENHRPRGITLSNNSIDMAATAPCYVGVVSTEDPDVDDVHSYTARKVGATSGFYNQFTVQNDTLYALQNFFKDTDETDSPRLQITTTDQGGLSYHKYIDLTLFTSGNHTPTDISLSRDTVLSNQPEGTLIGILSTTDPDLGDQHTYSVSSHQTSGSYVNFTISGDKLRTGPGFNAQDGDSVYCNVTTRDQDGRSYSKVFYIHVTAGAGANHRPRGITLTGKTVDESFGDGQFIGTLATEDEDEGDTHWYTVNPYFTTSGMYNVFTVSNDTLYSGPTFFNYYGEGDRPRISVTTTDNGGLSYTTSFNLSVVSTGNNAPTGISLSSSKVRANSPKGTFVATITAEDPNPTDTHTFQSLNTSSTSGSYIYFTVSNDSLFVGDNFNFEEGDTAPCKLKATDQGGKSYTKTMEIEVMGNNNENHKPTGIELSPNNMIDLEGYQYIGRLKTIDPDQGDTHEYKVRASSQSTTDSYKVFILRDDSLYSGGNFDDYYSFGDDIAVHVTTKDQGGLQFSKEFAITLTPESNNKPTGITLSRDTIASDMVKGDTIGILTTRDPDKSDSHQYKVLTHTTGDYYTFGIKDNYLVAARDIPYSDGQIVECEVRTTDLGGLFYDQMFKLKVVAGETGNHKPTGIMLSNNSIVAKSPKGTPVGELITLDEDVDDRHYYTVETSSTSGSYAVFFIQNDTLRANYQFPSKCTNAGIEKVVVRSTDRGGLSVLDTLEISITATPEIIAVDDTVQVDEGATATTLINGETSLIANDTLLGQTVEVDIESMPKHGNLLINDDGTFTYTHDGSESLVDSFSYVVHSDVSHDFGTVMIIIGSQNDNIPVAEDDIFNVIAGTLFESPHSVLDNDSDGDLGATLTTTLHTDAQYGNVILNSDGTFEYDAVDDEITDRFYYTVSDGEHTAKGMVILVIENCVSIEMADLKKAKKYGIMAIPSIVNTRDESVTFKIDGDISGEAELVIFDGVGDRIAQKFIKLNNGGSCIWDLRNKSGKIVSAGSYLAIMEVVQRDGTATYYKTMLGVRD